MSAHNDMSGFWTGEYRYSSDPLTVRFSASLQESDGVLSGFILEPNTFILNDSDEAHAVIDGKRLGHGVIFTKLYTTPIDETQPPLLYQGSVNGDFTRVVGVWHFTARSQLTGSFTMSRVTGAASRAAVDTASEIPGEKG